MIFEIVVLLLAIPSGFLIARLARDELIQGRKYFKILVFLSVLGIIGFWIYGKPVEAWTFGFIFIVSFISWKKSFDKKWAKERGI